jgi:hypothetical protein
VIDATLKVHEESCHSGYSRKEVVKGADGVMDVLRLKMMVWVLKEVKVSEKMP